MWTLANAKTDLDIFLGPKMIPYTWMLDSKFSRKLTTKSSDWYKILQSQSQISTSFRNWGYSGSLHQKTWLESLAREESLSPVVTSTVFKDEDEQLKLAHKVVDVVDRANKKICVTLLTFHCGQAGEVICSNPINCREEGERDVSTKWVCEI